MSLARGLTTALSALTTNIGRSTGGSLLGDDVSPSESTALTPGEESALQRVRTVATVLDESIRVPGTSYRIGLDPILGVVPGGGDAVAATLSLYPILEGYRLDVPPATLVKMLWLVAIDAVVGSVPIVGPLFDAGWKANEWNVRAIESHLDET